MGDHVLRSPDSDLASRAKQRGDQRRMLELKDWFVPALFHAGAIRRC
ncbi:MAG: hypothetical protein O3A00_20305 [Planctomycetota bacterium]|nr:hypothetical protein [Planctomycetota bacterium]